MRDSKNRTAVILISVGGLIALLPSLANGAVVRDVVSAWFFYLFAIVMPGWAIVLATLNRYDLSLIQKLSLALGGGLAAQIAFIHLSAAIGYSWVFYAWVAAAGSYLVYKILTSPCRILKKTDLDTSLVIPQKIVFLVIGGLLMHLLIVSLAYVRMPAITAPSGLHLDMVWHLGNIHEAARACPITDARVSGLTMTYHTWAYLHLGHLFQVTGVAPPVALLALFPCIYSAGIVIGALSIADSCFSKKHRLFFRYAALFFVVLLGELDPTPAEDYLFINFFMRNLSGSPTYALGFVLLFPTLALIGTLLDDKLFSKVNSPLGGYVFFVLLTFGCLGAKGNIVPMLGAGLGFATVLELLLMRFRDDTWKKVVRLSLLLGIVIVAYIFGSWLIYSDVSGSVNMAFFESANLWGVANYGFPLGFRASEGLFQRILIGCLIFVGGLNLKLLFIWLAICRGKWRSLSSSFFVFLGVALSGCVVTMIFFANGYAELFFYCSAIPIFGVCALAGIDPENLRKGGRLFVLNNAGSSGIRRVGKRIGWSGVLILGAIAALDSPFDLIGFSKKAEEIPVASDPNTISEDDLAAAEWLKKNSNPLDVIAVNVCGQPEAGRLFKYSGVYGRRVFLEGWWYTKQGQSSGFFKWTPIESSFPERFALNTASFIDVELEAINRMAEEFGVSFLVGDKRFPMNPKLDELFPPVFEQGVISIHRISAE